MLPILLLFITPLLAGAAQYCQFQGSHHPLTLCTAVNTHQNLTTSSADWSITFGYQRIHEAGWAAIGIGSGMYGSLMFVMYAKNKSSKDPILSVRRGLGYYEPEPVGAKPQVVTSTISLNETGWLEASFTCYRCDAWSSVNSGSALQPWIWAANANQVFSDPSPDSTMEQHGYYGHFDLDMSVVESKDGRVPSIDFTASDSVAIASGSGGLGQSPSALFALHGLLMALSTMILYPCGVLAISRASKAAFKGHVLFQLVASFLCIAGVLLALYATISNGEIGVFARPHVLLGLVVTTAVPLQVVLGYVHHKRYISAIISPKVTTGHRWLGRLIVAGGCINALLGLQMVAAPKLLKIFALTFVLIDIALLGVVARSRAVQRRMSKAISTEQDEDFRPFLRNDED
ncbi:integral membrane protein [Fusarium beomiforme]|uniref:Integral membrane protein n=1 Tax=Fusarium beomiforme TaxID=44412 RepID=A0A9P5A8M0_9HYPO|nr:integral membrane protein [Fusarium beomiforme]